MQKLNLADFGKFYSQQRLDRRKKGAGLGFNPVKKAAVLPNEDIELVNCPDG
jgi:hypothetical protein